MFANETVSYGEVLFLFRDVSQCVRCSRVEKLRDVGTE